MKTMTSHYEASLQNLKHEEESARLDRSESNSGARLDKYIQARRNENTPHHQKVQNLLFKEREWFYLLHLDPSLPLLHHYLQTRDPLTHPLYRWRRCPCRVQGALRHSLLADLRRKHRTHSLTFRERSKERTQSCPHHDVLRRTHTHHTYRHPLCRVVQRLLSQLARKKRPM